MCINIAVPASWGNVENFHARKLPTNCPGIEIFRLHFQEMHEGRWRTDYPPWIPLYVALQVESAELGCLTSFDLSLPGRRAAITGPWALVRPGLKVEVTGEAVEEKNLPFGRSFTAFAVRDGGYAVFKKGEEYPLLLSLGTAWAGMPEMDEK